MAFNSETNKKGILGKDIVSNLGVESKVICQPAIVDGVQYDERPEIEFNDLPISWLTNAIVDSLNKTQFKELNRCVDDAYLPDLLKGAEISDLIEACFKGILGMRLADVNEKRCEGGRANIEYPSLIGPIVAAYGRVDRSDIGLRITPIPSQEFTEELVNLGFYTVQSGKDINFENVKSYQMPMWYRDFMKFFRIYKLMTNYGMPADREVKDDTIYRVTTAHARLVGQPAVIAPDVQLIATVIKAASLATIYGQYRVEYCAITSMRSAIEDIALKAIHLNAKIDE